MQSARNGAITAPAGRRHRDSRRIGGFTALELLIALAVAAILVAVGVPSFTDLLRQVRLASTMNQITSDLYAAKGEAIKRNTRVLVCAKSSGSNTCATATNWSTGWVVCFDADANGSCDASTTTNPNPLIVRNAIHQTLTLTGPSAPLTFTSTGPTTAAATLTLTGTWTSAPSKQAAVALTGFIGTS
jgi:type IV fimbrial biogenesis protein FimT